MRRMLVALLVTVTPLTASAGLSDRGGGLIYDDVLDITWMQRTGGTGTGLGVLGANVYDCITCFDGTIDNQFVWNGVQIGGWRLPKRLDPSLGLTDSEITYMFRVNLNLTGQFVPSGNLTDITVTNGVVVRDVTEDKYWLAERWSPPFGSGEGFLWTFEIDSNPQLGPVHSNNYGALWWVRDGDVSQVPEPSLQFLLGFGAIAVILASRSKQKRLPESLVLSVHPNECIAATQVPFRSSGSRRDLSSPNRNCNLSIE